MNQDIRLFLGVLILGLFFSCARTHQQIIENTSEFQKHRNSIVRVENKHGFFSRGIGSGFFVERGKIATNIHVIAHPGPIYVKSADKKTIWKVEGVAAYDVKNDLAILKVMGEGDALPLGNSDSVQGGESISVVGYSDGKYKVTKGTLHSIRNTDKWLQMEVNTVHGSSGGPVLNSKGQVVGIFASLDSFYGHAIPSNTLRVLLMQSESTEPLEQWHKRGFIRSYAHHVKGEENYRKKRYDKAIIDLDEAIRLNPESIYAYAKRGDAKNNLGDYKGTISDYDRVLDLNPTANAYYNRGNAKQSLGDYEGAIADYDKAIQLNPKTTAYNNRGMAKNNLGDHEGAISDYDKALDLNPEDVNAYNNRGIAKDNLGDHKGAISDYDKALDLNPEDVNAYNNRGIAKDNLGDHKGAISDYNKALDLNPEDADAYNNRGIARLLRGISESKQENTKKALDLFEAAIADFDKNLEINSKDAIAYKNRGAAKFKLGELEFDRGNVEKTQILYEAAIVDLDKAIQLNPRSTGSYRNRAHVKEALGQHDAAKADFEKAKELDSDSSK